MTVSAVAGDEPQLRYPGKGTNPGERQFFDPPAARELYRTAKSLDELNSTVKDIPSDVWEFYFEWRQTIKKSSDRALETLLAHPQSELLKRLYDTGATYDVWLVEYSSFPNRRASFDEWAAHIPSRISWKHCDEEPGANYHDIFYCLPKPDWRDEDDKSVDTKAFENGERARVIWHTSPCPEIEKRLQIFQPIPEVWFENDCELKRENAVRPRDPDS